MSEMNETPEVQEETTAPQRSKSALRWIAFTLLMLIIAALTTTTVLAGDGNEKQAGSCSKSGGCCFSSLFHCSSSGQHPDAVAK